MRRLPPWLFGRSSIASSIFGKVSIESWKLWFTILIINIFYSIAFPLSIWVVILDLLAVACLKRKQFRIRTSLALLIIFMVLASSLTAEINAKLTFLTLDHSMSAGLIHLIALFLSAIVPGHIEERGRIKLYEVLFFSLAGFIWCQAAWDIGGDAIWSNFSGSRLNTTFSVWENESSHYYLAFFEPNHYGEKIAYSNFPQLYMGMVWLWGHAVHLITGISTTVAVSLAPVLFSFFLVSACVASLVLDTQIGSRRTCMFYILGCMTMGLVLTAPSFWGGLRWAPESPLPLLVASNIIISAKPTVSWTRNFLYFLALILAAITNPMQAILLIPFLIYLHEPKKWRIYSVILILAAISMICPKILMLLGGWKDFGSSFLFRSGLDGATDFFRNSIQAIFEPINQHQRLWIFTPWLALGSAYLIYVRLTAKDCSTDICAYYLTATLTYWLTAIFFGQALSIHPYGYDFLLIGPLAWAIGRTSLYEESLAQLTKFSTMMLFLVFLGLIVNNLIQISQFARLVAK